jgi:hypothetical protein
MSRPLTLPPLTFSARDCFEPILVAFTSIAANAPPPLPPLRVASGFWFRV